MARRRCLVSAQGVEHPAVVARTLVSFVLTGLIRLRAKAGWGWSCGGAVAEAGGRRSSGVPLGSRECSKKKNFTAHGTHTGTTSRLCA